MKKLLVKERIEIAGQLVLRSKVFLDIWDFYHSHKKDKFLDTINEYPNFFIFDEAVHRFSFIVHAAALFETGDTINLQQLAEELHGADTISDVAMMEINQLFASMKRIIKGIHIIRSNAFAHRSTSLSFEKSFEKAEISLDDLRDLMDVALKIANILLVACKLDQKEFFNPPLNELRHIISALSICGQ